MINIPEQPNVNDKSRATFLKNAHTMDACASQESITHTDVILSEYSSQ